MFFCSVGTTVGFVSVRKIDVFLQRGNNCMVCKVQANHPSAPSSARPSERPSLLRPAVWSKLHLGNDTSPYEHGSANAMVGVLALAHH